MTHQSLMLPWGVNDINELLKPEPLRLEMGLTRNSDGWLTVAIRTDLHGCKGRMLDWWFTFSKPPSTSVGGIRTIMSNTAAGTSTGEKAKATWVPASTRWNG